MDTIDLARVNLLFNGATFTLVLAFGLKLVRMFSRIEREHEMLWTDYEVRIGLRND